MNNSSSDRPSNMSREKYARLMAEAKAPYRGLRKFIYGTVGASGAIGAFVFLAQIASGREIGAAIPNFLFQVGIVALMAALFRWENRPKKP